MFHVLTSTYLQPPDVIAQTRPAHLQFLEDEIAAGRLVLAGRQESGAGGVLITGDLGTEAVQDIIDRDPYTRAGVATYDVVGFNAAVRAPGL
ncbi:MAG TPA: YciI family protein [Mycobacterium sp.]|nr:YciI family protein [Mycobacterium sp.]